MGVVSDLIVDINDVLGVRDDLGVALKDIYIVTRTWSGTQAGDGTFTEAKVRMLPTPRVVEFKKDLRVREGGAVPQADIMLKMVSKESYTRAQLDFSDAGGPIEKFYEVGGELFLPIGLTEKHVVWNVMLRRKTGQGRS